MRYSLLVLISVVSVSCSSEADHRLQKEDNGKTLQLGVGETVDFRLVQCQGCEQQWKVSSGWPACLVLTEDKFIANAPGTNGGSGNRIFTFTSKSPCSTTLVFTYYGDTLRYNLQVR
jgi:hypothetical protein